MIPIAYVVDQESTVPYDYSDWHPLLPVYLGKHGPYVRSKRRPPLSSAVVLFPEEVRDVATKRGSQYLLETGHFQTHNYHEWADIEGEEAPAPPTDEDWMPCGRLSAELASCVRQAGHRGAHKFRPGATDRRLDPDGDDLTLGQPRRDVPTTAMPSTPVAPARTKRQSKPQPYVINARLVDGELVFSDGRRRKRKR